VCFFGGLTTRTSFHGIIAVKQKKSILGHLVNEQRPPTVLNVGRQPPPPVGDHNALQQRHHSPDGTAAASESASAIDSGQAAAADLHPCLVAPLTAAAAEDLDRLSAQLRDKTRDLLAANLSQTKYFFKKLKKYIDYLAAPSDTVAECRQVYILHKYEYR
jgi:hypothetical protein